MQFGYFPGCTLKNKASDLDKYARISASALGIDLIEIEEWQCCGGVFTSSSDEIATKLSSVRTLISAKKVGNTLVTVCSACHNVIKQTNHAMKNDAEFAERVNNYISPEKYHGETKVVHYLEVLRDYVGFDEISKRITRPYQGIKIAPYYGCLLLRPGEIMRTDDAENPTVMENFIRSVGGEVVKYSMRNECCGGYIAVEDKIQAEKNSRRIIDNVIENVADVIVTACPLCRYNLIKNGKSSVPVIYFTELLYNALGLSEENQ